MKVDITVQNPALVDIMENSEQFITLDANFLIPPDRRPYSKHYYTFEQFERVWLKPIFKAFPNLAIHEAVYEEFIEGTSVHDFARKNIENAPAQLELYKDSDLSDVESNLRDSLEAKIYPLTKYDPLIDNKDDRGEVKSLAYIATKGLLYFAAHDNNAIQLIEKADDWDTGLDNVKAIQIYEIIYYLHVNQLSSIKDLRILYKYQYHLTKKEKNKNPEWGNFKKQMDRLYED